MKHLVIFASGSGTNAQNIAEYFQNSDAARVSAIFCNNSNAFVLERAKKMNLPVCLFNRKQFYESDYVADNLRKYTADFVILAGFLWLIPEYLIKQYPEKIINIHPALLPKYGGKGMYGNAVHEAVIASADIESGISIHFVDEKYDHGKIIFQAKCPVTSVDTPETLARKIHQLEYEYFPKIIERVVLCR
jgi:phosphoribosylglycinamide formyltransferase-1